MQLEITVLLQLGQIQEKTKNKKIVLVLYITLLNQTLVNIAKATYTDN